MRRMNWLQKIASTHQWYHATTPENARDILTKGWSVAVPRKTDPGDLGWGIYFYPHSHGQYGSAILRADIDMTNVIDIHGPDPRAAQWRQLVEIRSKDDPAKVNTYRTVRPDLANDDMGFIDRVKHQDPNFFSNPTKRQYVRDYYQKNRPGEADRATYSKMTRRIMLGAGVQGVFNDHELCVYNPLIIKSTIPIVRNSSPA